MLKRLTAFATLSLTTTALFLACSNSTPTSPPPPPSDAATSDASHPACPPGESVLCVCPGGGFGTTVCAATGTGFSACTGCPVDGSAPRDATPPSDAIAPTDGAPGDAAADASPPPLASLVFAHAAPGVPPVRLCLGTASTLSPMRVVPLAALPDAPSTAPAVPALGSFPSVAQGTPGFYPGTITALPALTDFSPLTVTFFAVLSSSVAGDVDLDGGLGVGPDGGVEETCVALLGSNGLGTADTPPGRLTAGKDFFPLPPIPAGTFQPAATYLLSLTGCLPGAGAGAATCGPDYDGGASAQVGIAPLDTTAGPAWGIGAQFAHRSSAIEGTPFTQSGGPHAPASSGVVPVFVTSAADGGTTLVPLQAAEPAVRFSGDGLVLSPAGIYAVDPAAPGTQLGVLLVPADGGPPSAEPYPTGDLLALPLSTINVLSDWTASTTSPAGGFATGLTYTFLLVGDPAAPPLALPPTDGGVYTYDGRGLHFVAFPNRFTPRAY